MDLKNESAVENRLNISIDEIWEEFPWILHVPPYNVIRCISISFPIMNSVENDLITVKFLKITRLKSNSVHDREKRNF